MDKNLPKISYCVFTYNEEKNIKGCLESIFSQNYPKDKLEVIIVDDNSGDRTVEIAKKFPVKILVNGKHDGDLSATIGFQHASGEFFTAIGADMRFCGNDWFLKMVKPLMENPNMAAAFTKFYSHPDDSLITQYLNLDPIQRDLVYQTFSIGFDKVITKKRDGYYVCTYAENKMPPQTHGLWRISVLREIIKKQKIYYDMGNLVGVVKNGYRAFGYVPDAGYYHSHAENIHHLLSKRIRNIQKSYLRYSKNPITKENQYKWIDLQNPKDIIKLVILIVCANLFIPIFLLSLIKIIKHKNLLYVLESPVTFLLVDTILFTFLKDKRGRELIMSNLSKLFTPHHNAPFVRTRVDKKARSETAQCPTVRTWVRGLLDKQK